MPSNIVKTKHDEKLWAKAKVAASRYESVKEGSDQYWSIVNGIFQRMKGNIDGKTATVVKKYTKSDYIKMAQDAAREYLQDNVPLNEAVAKIAFINGLIDHQIKNVCSTANHLVHAAIMKDKEADEDKYIDFEIARPEKIADEIDSMTQVADDVYLNPDSLFHVTPQKKEAEESYGQFVNKTIQKAQLLQQNIKNIAIAHSKVADELLSEVDKTEEKIDKLYDYTKELILNGVDVLVIRNALSKAFKDANNFSLVWSDIVSRLVADNVIERPPSDTDRPNSEGNVDALVPNSGSPVIIAAMDIDRRLNKTDELEKMIYGLEKMANEAKESLTKELVTEKLANPAMRGIGKWFIKKAPSTVVSQTKKPKGKMSKLINAAFIASGATPALKKRVKVKRNVL